MSHTGSIRSVVSYEDNVTTGDCSMWNDFVAEYAVAPREIRSTHQKYHWRPGADKVNFDGLVVNNKFLVCSTETKSNNIVPNVTFNLQVNLQANQVEFVFAPDLEEGTEYRMMEVDIRSFSLWKTANQVYNR